MASPQSIAFYIIYDCHHCSLIFVNLCVRFDILIQITYNFVGIVFNVHTSRLFSDGLSGEREGDLPKRSTIANGIVTVMGFKKH